MRGAFWFAVFLVLGFSHGANSKFCTPDPAGKGGTLSEGLGLNARCTCVPWATEPSGTRDAR